MERRGDSRDTRISQLGKPNYLAARCIMHRHEEQVWTIRVCTGYLGVISGSCVVLLVSPRQDEFPP